MAMEISSTAFSPGAAIPSRHTCEGGGPCPPVGRHRYFHKLYALDVVLRDLERPTKAQVEAAMKGHVMAQAELFGTYEKARK